MFFNSYLLFYLLKYRNFPIRLENPHVIQDNQLWAGIVPVGPSGHPFNSSYRTRDSPEYKLNLGNSIGKYIIYMTIFIKMSCQITC